MLPEQLGHYSCESELHVALRVGGQVCYVYRFCMLPVKLGHYPCESVLAQKSLWTGVLYVQVLYVTCRVWSLFL